MFRKQNCGNFSPKSPDCLPDGSGGHIRIARTAARPVGQSPTATNAHDPVTNVEPWLLLYIVGVATKCNTACVSFLDLHISCFCHGQLFAFFTCFIATENRQNRKVPYKLDIWPTMPVKCYRI
jgi:hypothetical protein